MATRIYVLRKKEVHERSSYYAQINKMQSWLDQM